MRGIGYCLLILTPLLNSGCGLAGLFYHHQYNSERFVIYTDHDQEFLGQIGPKIEQIYEGYQRLFQVSPHQLGKTSIILRGTLRDQQVVDMAYSPNLLGYYIPFLKLVSVDTKPLWVREEGMLQQILLHEIAHQFIVHRYPNVSSRCWLNEGLASTFEVTLFEEDRFEYHLLNPTLLGIARRAVLLGRSAASLKRLLELDWGEFHHGENKDLDYALSWAVVYYILEEKFPAEGTLLEKMDRLWKMDNKEILELEPAFLDFLRHFDLTGILADLVNVSRDDPLGELTPRWAVHQLGSLKLLDEPRAVCALEGLLDSPDPILASHARQAFLNSLVRNSESARKCVSFHRGRERIAKFLLDSSHTRLSREALARSVANVTSVDPWWIPILIHLLEAPESELRVAAARGLGNALVKPTVVNPSFWRAGDPTLRAAEVEEWRTWCAGQDFLSESMNN